MISGASQAPGVSRRLLLGGSAALLGGCTLALDRDHTGPNAPRAAPLPSTPRTAWVLSSGGPRGFVHVGVIKALTELQLQPDLVVGCSIGALVGVMYCAGMPAAQIEALALDLDMWRLARLAFSTQGRLSGAPIADLVDAQLELRIGTALLERLPVPAICAVQRLADRAVVGWSAGDAGPAVQAATAIEGRFTPVRVRGQAYGDADLSMPMPVRLARALGATRVLAVDASAHEERAPAGTEEWRASDLHKRALTRPDTELADVVLHPDFGYWAGMTREFRLRSIAAGYRDTLAQAARLRALHAG